MNNFQSLGFPYFTAIESLYNEGVNLPPLNKKFSLKDVLPRLIKTITDTEDDVLKFETLALFERDRFAWFMDEEFSRQTLASLNLYNIKLVTEWPLKSMVDPKIYGPPESAITTQIVEREIGGFMTVEQVADTLRTHCCTEPYIIATNWQLSAMHPIYRLLHRHFCYTMEINALAREALINAEGIIESSFSSGKYSMELSSAIKDQQWQFDWQALPANLLSRGMAVKDPCAPHGLKLTIEDYPFANDGLILCDSIKQWVTEYVNHYNPEAKLVESDQELQAWWTEIRTKGHGDKKDEPWWPYLKTQEDLVGILTTMTWCFSSQVQATKVLVVLDVLSNHSPEEEYIGGVLEPSWAEELAIKAAFEKFNGQLEELEGIIDERNNNRELRNRSGAGIVPYNLLKPFSNPGAIGMGVPSSISI
ncbi:hypothetical protein Ancab_024723 [Ancistrocladus abbreviatus]